MDDELQKSPFPGIWISRVEELKAKLAEIAASPHEPAAHFAEFWFDMPIDPLLDPLSRAYRDAVLSYYSVIVEGDRSATPIMDPASIAADSPLVIQPWPYSTGAGDQVGMSLQAIGFIITTCRLRRGHRVLQLGVANANLALQLAQMGCSVTALDADPGNVVIVQHRAERLGVTLSFVHAEVTAAAVALDGQQFDVVVFNGEFSRIVDHPAVLRMIRERLLARGGRVILAGEPLLETLPTAWGLNPSGGGIWANRNGRGPVLAFRPSYLIRAFEACGYAAAITTCPMTSMGNVIMAVRAAQSA